MPFELQDSIIFDAQSTDGRFIIEKFFTVKHQAVRTPNVLPINSMSASGIAFGQGPFLGVPVYRFLHAFLTHHLFNRRLDEFLDLLHTGCLVNHQCCRGFSNDVPDNLTKA